MDADVSLRRRTDQRAVAGVDEEGPIGAGFLVEEAGVEGQGDSR